MKKRIKPNSSQTLLFFFFFNMDLLKEAIQEKRKLVEAIDTFAKKEIGENKKYIKRGEKERVLEKIFSKEDEEKKQEQKENESKQPDQPVFKKRKVEEGMNKYIYIVRRKERSNIT